MTVLGTGAKVFLGGSLDLLAGEPRKSWHPVCWMGKVVDLADWAAPGRERGVRAQRLSGAAVAVALPAGTFLLTKNLLRWLPRPVAGAVEIALISTALAAHSLDQHARRVEDGLVHGLEEAREQVGHMVGRDAHELDEDGVIRAAIESVAENANDGVIAPLFYALIGGAPLALAYKMVNTLDSMIGYKDEQYLYFGWIAARLDDAAGFIPARLTVLAAAILSPLVGGNREDVMAALHRDTGLHDSPNAGICESAYSGALGVRLGGINYYSGLPVLKPVMGQGCRKPETDDIARAARLMYASSALVLSAGIFVRTFLAVVRIARRRRGR